VLPAPTGAALREAVAQVKTGHSPSVVEYALPMPAGTQHYQAHLVPLDAGRVVCLVNDTSAHKRSEETLRRQQAQIRHLLALSPAVVYSARIDGQALVPSGVTENVSRILGYTQEECLAPSFWDTHVHPEDQGAAAPGSTTRR
jgi:PAS domain-containing protein